VDTLQPWREELQMLNEVFADPNILKILHGSTMDIIWLQRDLGLYLVGLFDTFHAVSALGWPKRSLKVLLQKLVNFEADKRYQMADWRVRPLPDAMFDYARSDTHYLLYIYDLLRNELVESSTKAANHVDYVLERSKNEALQRYERPVYDAANGLGPGGWYDLLSRNPGVLPKEQFAVFKAVHQWRDEVARAEDEGWQCVFPRHMLFKLAQTMPLDMGVLLRTLSPVTPITKERAHDLLEVIQKAKTEGATGPEWHDVAPPPKSLAKAVAAVPQPEITDFPAAERYEKSQFWGNVLEAYESPAPPTYSLVAAAEALRLSLPLPPMPSTVSQTREKLGTTAKPPPSTISAPSTTPAPAQEQPKIFTVKELGGPRKRKAAPAEPTEQAPSTPDELLVESSNEPESTEKRRKKSRKDKKSKKSSQTDSQPENEETPFDYGAAESVFNAAPAQAPSRRQKKHFNPYAKAMDAPSGARKQNREIGGKSHTFRE
jgi:exosome complex exonuclease RRP6